MPIPPPPPSRWHPPHARRTRLSSNLNHYWRSSMQASNFSLRRVLQCAALVLATLSGDAVLAQTIELDANCVLQLTRQQQRLYQKANDGSDALRQFIFIRRAILQVDTYETATWAE